MHPRIAANAKFSLSLMLMSAPVFAGAEPISAARHLERPLPTAVTSSPLTQTEPVLPPLPDGVVELKFSTMFKTPVGPRGLEVAEELQALDGRRVRVVGFMVREQAADHDGPAEGEDASAPMVKDLVHDRFLLTASPQTTNFSHYGLCEDLPPQVVYVTLAEPRNAPVPFTSRPLLLTGVLSVGMKSELDGRHSIIRLKLDPASDRTP